MARNEPPLNGTALGVRESPQWVSRRTALPPNGRTSSERTRAKPLPLWTHKPPETARVVTGSVGSPPTFARMRRIVFAAGTARSRARSDVRAAPLAVHGRYAGLASVRLLRRRRC